MSEVITPTRDEADALLREVVPVLEAVQRSIQPRYIKGLAPANGVSEDGPLIERIRHYLAKLASLATSSAPAPASGGVDAVARLIWNRWHARHGGDYDGAKGTLARADTEGLAKQIIASLSPAATPVSEAGGEPDMRRVCEALGFDPTNHHNAAKCPYCNPDQADAPKLTYRSTQATTCASCGEHKHTPLRRDEMGGYVCLTCIDKRLAALAKPASSPAGGDEIARWKRDSELLSAIQDECWDVRFTNSPNADAGDYNVNIEIVGHFMADPQERVVGENYNENLRAALEQAMTAESYPPARPIYDQPDESEDTALSHLGNGA